MFASAGRSPSRCASIRVSVDPKPSGWPSNGAGGSRCPITRENADPGVQHDMLLVLNEVAPREDQRYRHIEDNSASHVQSSMMGCSTFVFVKDRELVLGTWQAIYLAEFDGPRERSVHVKVVAD